MKQLSSLLLVAIAIAAGGCDAQAPQSADAATGTPPPQTKEKDMSELKPPSADSVLYFIYQRDGDGAQEKGEPDTIQDHARLLSPCGPPCVER